MVEEKKAKKKSKVVVEEKKQTDDRSEGANVAEKKKESIWKLLVTTVTLLIALLLFASIFIPSIIPKFILDVIPVFLLDSILIRFIIMYFFLFISLATSGGLNHLFIIARMVSTLFEITSFSEKIKQEITSGISVEKGKLRRQIEVETDYEVRKELRQEYESLLIENLQTKEGEVVKDWREVLLSSRRRLLNEEERLLARNRANLRIGIVSVLSGITLLIIFLFMNNEARANSNFIDFLTIYWARIGIVITIGVFAGFFLRLYSLTERAIANNKNEITNIELRLTSGLLLHKKTSAKKFDSLADDLAKEERNFVLKKNETSAITDSDKLDIDRAVEIAIKAMKAGL